MQPDDVLLAVVPLFHVFGLNAVLGSALMSGARLVIMDGFDGFADIVAEEKITNLPVAPALLTRILADERAVASVNSVTRVVSGAAPLSLSIFENSSRRVPDAESSRDTD